MAESPKAPATIVAPRPLRLPRSARIASSDKAVAVAKSGIGGGGGGGGGAGVDGERKLITFS